MTTLPKFLNLKTRERITAKEIYSMLFKRFGIPNKKEFLWGISDRFFFLASEDEIKSVIEKDNTNTKVFVPEVGDCDNYAFELRAAFGRKGWAVGVLYVDTTFGLHAVFFYITDKRELKIVEPQSDNPFNEANALVGVVMY